MKSSHEIEVSTPLGDDKLLFRRMRGVEELGRPFEYQLTLFSSDGGIKHEDILGQNVTVRLLLGSGKERYFNGFAVRFVQTGVVGNYFVYEATVRPWLWFLTRTADCRIFQEKTVPDIVKEVFRDHGFTDFDESLSGTYRKWDYCVQYRETDFDFISRLMEHEGIYYYFNHEDGKHSLVLADSYSAHAPIPGYESVPYFPPSENAIRDTDFVWDWRIEKAVQTGVLALTDYDFEKPKADLQVKTSIDRKHSSADLEVFDYPGNFLATGDGDTYAKARIEEIHAGYERLSGEANTRGFFVGGLFSLTDYPREDQNREYLVTRVEHDLELDAYESGKDAGSPPTYQCKFRTIESRTPYRTPRTTPKPSVNGPQTAVVVGKSGEEIWTDKYGRVKVQFPWDRYGKMDENSSCWIRVAQVWAGKGWGAMQIPRMGQEVVVEFLEGDPDRPLITGRVYNGDNMPPYGLPANQTQSGLISRSTKGASTDNFNELRFEDKKGEEQLYIHAEKNQDGVVENDETQSVGNDQSISIGNNRTESVGKNESVAIGENRDESVGKNESVTVGENRTLSVGKDESISVAQNQSEDVGKKASLQVGDDRTIDIGKDQKLSVGKKWTNEAGDEILFKTGSASIKLSKNGDIVIKGKNIKIQGSGKINVKASSAVAIKGSKITQN